MAIFDCHCDPVRRLPSLSLRTSPQTGVAIFALSHVTGVAISDAEKRSNHKIPTAVWRRSAVQSAAAAPNALYPRIACKSASGVVVGAMA